MSKVEISNFKTIGRGSLKAFFDLKLVQTSMVFHDCALFEKDGRRWVNLPQKIVEQGGAKKYFPVVEITDKALRERFQKSVKQAIDAHLGAKY